MVLFELDRAQTKEITQPKNVAPRKKFKTKMAVVDGCSFFRAIKAGKKYKGMNSAIISGTIKIPKSFVP